MDFKKKLGLELGISVVLILGLTGGILFFGSRLETSAEEMRQVRAELALRSKSLNAVAALRSEYDMKIKERLKALIILIPVKDQLINLTKDFQLVSSKDGLQSTFTFVGESSATDFGLGKVTFRLSTEGDFEKLIGFVTTLQNFHYLSSFDSFSLLRGKESSVLGTHGSVFFRNQLSGDLSK